MGPFKDVLVSPLQERCGLYRFIPIARRVCEFWVAISKTSRILSPTLTKMLVVGIWRLSYVDSPPAILHAPVVCHFFPAVVLVLAHSVCGMYWWKVVDASWSQVMRWCDRDAIVWPKWNPILKQFHEPSHEGSQYIWLPSMHIVTNVCAFEGSYQRIRPSSLRCHHWQRTGFEKTQTAPLDFWRLGQGMDMIGDEGWARLNCWTDDG